MNKIKQSLRTKFIFYITLIFLIIFLIVLFIGLPIFNNAMYDLVLKNSQNEAEMSHLKISYYINTNIDKAKMISESPAVIKWLMNEQNETLKKNAFEEIRNFKKYIINGDVFEAVYSSSRFYLHDTLISVLSEKDPDDSWYYMTVNKKPFNLNIDFNDDLTETRLWINILVKKNKKLLGVVGTGIDIKDFVDNIITTNDKKDFIVLCDSNGLIKAHKNKKLIENKTVFKAFEYEVNKNKVLRNIFKHIKNTFNKKTFEINWTEKTIRKHMENAVKYKNIQTFKHHFNNNDYMVSIVYLEDIDWFIFVFNDLSDILLVKELIPLFIVLICAFIMIFFIIFMLVNRLIIKPFKKIKITSNQAAKGILNMKINIKSNTEVGELSGYFNDLLDNFGQSIKKIKESSNKILSFIQNISVSSKEIATTSNNQAASVKEIVSTMEDSSQLSRDNHTKAEEVFKIADKTRENVEKGFVFLKKSMGKMNDIKQGNSDTINGIRSLGKKINNIWEIVNIINTIADQTKIIAFNAELEASAAGEAGKNFKIVAGEIRRLANNTVSSTSQIKNMINEIQHSSDNLVIASEEGTENIKKGWEISKKLTSIFNEILFSSEVSANSAKKIANSINMQAGSSDQILLTLKQISSGIDNFVMSTSSLTDTSEKLKEMASDLENIVKKYVVD